MDKTENELIAEFMGILFDESGQCTDPERKYSWRPGVYDPLRVNHLQYDTNWSWLMPVVEKIRKIVERNHSKSVGPENEDMELFDKIVDNGLAWVDIDGTYKAVVEFIKWHNTQKL